MKYAEETGGGSGEQIASRMIDWGSRVLRYGLALVVAWIGLMKFTEYEANGIRPLVANSPLLGWAYDFMKRVALSPVAIVLLAGVAASAASAFGRAAAEGAPVFVTEIPPGYRDWRLVSVAREEGTLDDIRAILGNDVAIRAYREGKLPFPEGAIIARLAWSYDSSEENNKAFGRRQSFVAGHPKNGVQFMVKDSRKYASTGGWGFGQFDGGKPADVAALNTCFACHTAVKGRDLVFTRYAP